MKYPNMLYHWDTSGHTKLSLSQAARQKALGGKPGHPDLVIYHRSGNGKYNCLFLEVKQSEDVYLTKTGRLKKSDHLIQQWFYMDALIRMGNAASFVHSVEGLMRLLENYTNPQIDFEPQLPGLPEITQEEINQILK